MENVIIDKNGLFDKYLKNTYSNLKEIGILIIPIIDDTLKAYEEYYKSRGIGFTDRDRDEVVLKTKKGLYNCLANYILPSDNVIDPNVKYRTGGIILSCVIERDGVRNFFETDIISAKGDIQTWHYRYIQKSNLGKIKSNLDQFTKELEKYTDLIQKTEISILSLKRNKISERNRIVNHIDNFIVSDVDKAKEKKVLDITMKKYDKWLLKEENKLVKYKEVLSNLVK